MIKSVVVNLLLDKRFLIENVEYVIINFENF